MLKLGCFAIITTLLLCYGCAAPETIDFFVHEGPVLKASSTIENHQAETLFRYRLEQPVIVSPETESLLLEFSRPFEELTVAVYSGDVELFAETLDGNFAFQAVDGGIPEKATFAVPLQPGVKFQDFSISYQITGAGADSAVPVSAGLGPAPAGVILAPGPIIDTRITARKKTGNPREVFTFDVSEITGAATAIAGIAVNYAYEPEPNEECSVTVAVEDKARQAEFKIQLRDGGSSVYLYEGMCGFTPQKVTVIVEGIGFNLTSLIVNEISRANGVLTQPIPIDMGGVVRYDTKQWRNDDFELFVWNLIPEILIIDTSSYSVQSAFFKRLAFFVEKFGAAGSLLPDEAIENRHGWNAHDYRAEDLARFFEKAQAELFPLGDAELLLRDILVNRGIIAEERGSWKPLGGGVITLSQESDERLRRLFMAHEGYHGIYFADASYRDVSADAWRTLSENEKRFWREFLRLRDYNIYDEYLVINEFQAYLMQIAHRDLDPYYWDYSVPALVEAVPRTEPIVEELKRLHPDTFHRSAVVLEAYLIEAHGFRAGNLFCLELL